MKELGDVLFVIANIGRVLGLNAEESLRQCNNKFETRFKGMEHDLRIQGKSFGDMTLNEMLKLWSKQKEKAVNNAA